VNPKEFSLTSEALLAVTENQRTNLFLAQTTIASFATIPSFLITVKDEVAIVIFTGSELPTIVGDQIILLLVYSLSPKIEDALNAVVSFILPAGALSFTVPYNFTTVSAGNS